MQKLGTFFRGRRPRKKIFAFLATFCVFCGSLVLTSIIQTRADVEYTIEFTSSQSDYGDFGLGYGCNGVTRAVSYTSTSSSTTANLVNNAIAACPKRGATFVGWSINGSDPSLYTSSNLDIYNSPLNDANIFFPDGATTATVEAVFARSSDYYDVTVSLSDADGGHINQVWSSDSRYSFDPVGEISDELVITTRYDAGEITVSNIGITVDSGYEVTGIVSSGDASGSLNNNNLTAIISGPGTITITVNYLQQYDVDIYTNNGTAYVDGNSYTINDNSNNSNHIDLTTAGIKTITVNATPTNGYIIDSSNPVSVSGNVTYNNDYNNGQFTITATGAGSVTINYVESDGYEVDFSVNDSSLGELGLGWECGSTSKVSAYTSTNSNPEISYPSGSSNALTACPKDGATFGGWRISGSNITSFTISESYVQFHDWVGDLGNSINNIIFANDNHNVNIEAIFISSAEYYDVIIEASPNGAGDLKITNTSQDYTANPDSTRSQKITLRVDATKSTVTTNSIQVRSLNNDYTFSHFEYETGNVSYDHATGAGHILAMTGPDRVKVIFVSSQKINYLTNDANVKIVEPGTTKEKSFDSLGALDDNPTGAGFVIDPSVSANYKFMYWQDEDGVAVSIDEDFVPTGALIEAGKTYTPVFDTTGNKRASVTLNIPSAGHLRYWSNSGNQWVDKATGEGLILGVGSGDHFAGNAYAVVDDENYYFDHWDIIAPDGVVIPFAGTICTEPGGEQANCLDASQGTYGVNQYYHVVAVYKPLGISYVSNPIPHTKGSQGKIYEPNTSTEKSEDPMVNPTGAEARSTDSYYFLYWTDENGNIVSFDETFVPTGDLAVSGATYYSNYCNSNYTCALFTVNDKTTGSVTDASRGDVTDYIGPPPIELDCADNVCHVHITEQATPSNPSTYYFHHWEISMDGKNFALLEGENLTAAFRPSVEIPMPAGQRVIFKAVFTKCQTLCFHTFSYSYANAYDTDYAGSKTIITENDEIVGVTETPNSNHYFAYWVTGCNTDENTRDGSGNSVLGAETIASLDETFYPTAEQLAVCPEYIAVFYRNNTVRMTFQTILADKGAKVEVMSSPYTGRDATTFVNFGVNWNTEAHPGLATTQHTVQATPPAGYHFTYWTINGEPLTTDGQAVDPSWSNVATSATLSRNGSWFTAYGDRLNVIVAHYAPNPLPFTGSFIIWLVVGGGVALVAIPSVILLINERKEQKKGGKK